MMEIAFLTLLCVLSSVNGHLVMTYPPARRFQLDFLDNVRTTPPCGGMDYQEGEPITTIKTGTPITATWHVAYPHMGGIRFELLNLAGGVIAELTGEGYQYANDSTQLSHELTFTDDHLCDHCVLRITRQAGEWTAAVGEYLFWSCADVNITAADDGCYPGQCLNGGTCSGGSCSCPKTYHGERCQYKNDCEDGSDCNSNGDCVDIQSTYYPKKVCYCNQGKMGRFCSKDSPVSEAVKSASDLENHYHTELFANPKFDLYWRIIGDNSDEIEFVVQVETKTWAAIGFRPNSVTDTCRNFPTNTGSGGPEPEGEGTGEPAATPESPSVRRRRAAELAKVIVLSRSIRETAETNVIKDLCLAGNTNEAIAWATRMYNADPSVPQPEGEGTPATEGEGTPAPEGEGTPAPEGEGTAAPEGEGTPEPEGEGTPAPEGEGEPGTGGGNLHAMDCQDMIIFSAVGNKHRTLDSYTRDRSTPRPDSFFGGNDDLTATAASIVDGKLHAVIRRKLATTDQADHTLTDSTALFVWARGQDPVRFYHWPLTGLERCQASNYDYYKINELKYHGTKSTQRGTRSINVFQNPNGTTSGATGSHSSPSGCSGDACNYVATWTYDKAEKKISFSVSARVALQKWAAIGFSDDQNMPNSDAIVMWMDDANSAPTVTDRFMSAKSPDGVALDSTSNVQVSGGTYSNGLMTIRFTRDLDTGDSNDFALNQCRYFLYAWGGDVTSSGLGYHNSNRETSTSKICVDSGSARIVLSSILSWSWIVSLVIYRSTLQ